MEYYKSKKVFITGGSSGIGKAVAVLLSQWGSEICIAARRENMLKQAHEEIKQFALDHDQKIIYKVLDVRDGNKTFKITNEIIEEFGGLDILINSHGAGWTGYF